MMPRFSGATMKDINAILTRFNAGFRLAKCGKNYVGKTPQSAFCLQFDGNDVDISKADGDEPSFRFHHECRGSNT